MLKKLIKNEFKATSHTFLPLFLIVAIITPVTGFLSKFSVSGMGSSTVGQIITVCSIVLYILSLIGLFVASFILVILRFYKNMVTEEAYLTHTLPVTTNQLVLAKIIVATVWQIATTFVLLISLSCYGLIYGVMGDIINTIADFLNSAPADLKSSLIVFFIFFVLTLLIGVIYNIYHIYASISIGQLVQNHRVLASFGFYLVIYTVMQVVSSVIIAIYTLSNKNNFITQSITVNSYSDLNQLSTLYDHITWLLIISSLISIVFTVAFHFISVYMMKRKLNLE